MSVWPSETIVIPPILLSPSLRAIDNAPTPNPRRFRPLSCAPTHTGVSAALSHENDDDDNEVPSNAERRAWCNRDTRVASNNARAHVRPDVTTVAVAMTATMTATVVVLLLVVRRAHRVTRRRRWRWRWRCRRLHGASSALRVTHTARYARACARHYRASRASSPFPSPPRTTGTRPLRRRSLA